MHSINIMYYIPENQDSGADKNTYKHDELCYPHHSIHSTEYNPNLLLR